MISVISQHIFLLFLTLQSALFLEIPSSFYSHVIVLSYFQKSSKALFSIATLLCCFFLYASAREGSRARLPGSADYVDALQASFPPLKNPLLWQMSQSDTASFRMPQNPDCGDLQYLHHPSFPHTHTGTATGVSCHPNCRMSRLQKSMTLSLN